MLQGLAISQKFQGKTDVANLGLQNKPLIGKLVTLTEKWVIKICISPPHQASRGRNQRDPLLSTTLSLSYCLAHH